MNTARADELRAIALQQARWQIESLDWGGVAETNEDLTDAEVDAVYWLALSATVDIPEPTTPTNEENN